MMALLFMGIGPFCYLFNQIEDRPDKIISGVTVIKLFNMLAPFFIIGYIVSLLIQFSFKEGIDNKKIQGELVDFNEGLLNKVKVLFFILSVVGYKLAQLEISTSGLGTLFPVFKSFLYPNMVLSIYTVQIKRGKSLLLALIICITGFYFAVTSWWRSELIMVSGAIIVGLLLKSRKTMFPVIILGIIGILYILPFQQLKKIEYEKTKQNLSGTFVKTLNLSFEERLAFASSFFAERINYGRELAYSQNGINKGYLEYRSGRSYLEVFLQLIPRLIWPDKPSFNTYNNRERALILGLVNEESDNTAWGVNIYADFILNFPFQWLILFVPLIMLVFRWLDKLAQGFSENIIVKFMITSTLFFISFEMVSLLYTSTFILWCFIVAKGMEYVLRMRWRKRLTI